MGIILEHVNKTYDGSKEVLEDINIKFPNKGIFAIVGRSGCGKSTLLNILSGHDVPSGGKYYLDDIDVSKNATLEANVSYLSQDLRFLNDFTVLDNLLLVTEDVEKIKNNLAKVDILDLLNQKVKTLSTGEKLRLGIVRELLKGTKVLLLDEPTSALDYDNALRLCHLLTELAKDKLIIMSTHNIDLLEEIMVTRIDLKPTLSLDFGDSFFSEINGATKRFFKANFILKYVFNSLKINRIKAIFNIVSMVILITLAFVLLNVAGFNKYDATINYLNSNSNITYLPLEVRTKNRPVYATPFKDRRNGGIINYNAYKIKVGSEDAYLYLSNSIDKVIVSDKLNKYVVNNSISFNFDNYNDNYRFDGLYSLLIDEYDEVADVSNLTASDALYQTNFIIAPLQKLLLAIYTDSYLYVKGGNFAIEDPKQSLKSFVKYSLDNKYRGNEIAVSRGFYETYLADTDLINTTFNFKSFDTNIYQENYPLYQVMQDFKVVEIIEEKEEIIYYGDFKVEDYLAYAKTTNVISKSRKSTSNDFLAKDIYRSDYYISLASANALNEWGSIINQTTKTTLYVLSSLLMVATLISLGLLITNHIQINKSDLILFKELNYEKKAITKIFKFDSLIITFLSLILGLSLGTVLFTLIDNFFSSPNFFNTNYNLYRLSLVYYLAIILISVLLSWLFSKYLVNRYYKKAYKSY